MRTIGASECRIGGKYFYGQRNRPLILLHDNYFLFGNIQNGIIYFEFLASEQLLGNVPKSVSHWKKEGIFLKKKFSNYFVI